LAQESAAGALSRLGAANLGVFRGRDAIRRGVTRDQLTTAIRTGVIERVLCDTYRMTAAPASDEQRLRAALLWAGASAAGASRSAGASYALEGVRPVLPEIALPRASGHLRSPLVIVHRSSDAAALMIRRQRGIPVTGVEATLLALGATLDSEAFEIACEDARRRRLTTVRALRAYVDRFGRKGIPGVGPTRALLAALDPIHPSRSTLEVKTRRLLVAHGITDCVREFPLEWQGRTYRFDFAFPAFHTILETNGRRWHDDPVDYEDDNEKWSVPGRYGYKLVLATWDKVVRQPGALVDELRHTLAA
jgi:hypothetical protein